MEGYGNDNPGAKSQGIKQLMAGGGVVLIGTTLIPLLSPLCNPCYDRRCAGKYFSCIFSRTCEYNILWLHLAIATKYAIAKSAIDNILDRTCLVKTKNWI